MCTSSERSPKASSWRFGYYLKFMQNMCAGGCIYIYIYVQYASRQVHVSISCFILDMMLCVSAYVCVCG